MVKYGGTFSTGTGPGVNPTCEFSGIGKTYNLNQLNAATFQNVLVSGEVVFSGTRLGIMEVNQNLNITGIMDIHAYSSTQISEVFVRGLSAGSGIFTGELTGTGRLWYVYRDGFSIPDTGTISIRYFRFEALTGLTGDSISTDLAVNGWTNVHQDFTHTGVEPWIDVDDGDTNVISIGADTAIYEYDEYYSTEDIDPKYISFTPTNVKVHMKARLYDGTGGHASLFIITAYVWDGTTWQNGGSGIFSSTSYTESSLNDISGVIDNLAKVNGMRLKFEVALINDGGADKGGLYITEVFVEIDGTGYRNPIFEIDARTWTTPCEVEISYTDDMQTFRLKAGRHYFGDKLTIHGNVSAINEATLDFATYMAEIWVQRTFDIYSTAFPSAVFNLLLGDGTHVFRGNVDFYFSYALGAATQLVVDPGNGTIIQIGRAHV